MALTRLVPVFFPPRTGAVASAGRGQQLSESGRHTPLTPRSSPDTRFRPDPRDLALVLERYGRRDGERAGALAPVLPRQGGREGGGGGDGGDGGDGDLVTVFSGLFVGESTVVLFRGRTSGRPCFRWRGRV